MSHIAFLVIYITWREGGSAQIPLFMILNSTFRIRILSSDAMVQFGSVLEHFFVNWKQNRFGK